MAGTLVLTDTIGADLRRPLRRRQRGHRRLRPRRGRPSRRRAAATSGPGSTQSLVDADRRPSTASPSPRPTSQAYAQLVDNDGEPIGDPDMGAPTFGGNWLDDDDLNPFELADGPRARRRPTRSSSTSDSADGRRLRGRRHRHRAHPGRRAGRHRRRHRHLRRRRQPRRRHRSRSSPSTAAQSLPRRARARSTPSGRRRRRRDARASSSSAIAAGRARRASRCSPAPRSPPRTRPTSRRAWASSTRSCWPSPSSPCSSARSSSTTPSRSSSPSAAGRWRCCGPSAPAAARCWARCSSRPSSSGSIASVAGLVAGIGVAVGPARRCSTAMGHRPPRRRRRAHVDDGGHLAGRRPRRQRRLGGVPGPPGQPLSPPPPQPPNGSLVTIGDVTLKIGPLAPPPRTIVCPNFRLEGTQTHGAEGDLTPFLFTGKGTAEDGASVTGVGRALQKLAVPSGAPSPKSWQFVFMICDGP